MVELLLIQWGIVGVFVFLHFLLGFLRGTSKSTYFTIVSIIMTFVTLWIVSLFTIRWFFTPETLLLMVNNFAPGIIPTEFEAYLTDPQLTGFAFAMIDLVLRIVGFIILYPILKTSITFTFFRPIWKRLILPKLLERQDYNTTLKYEKKNIEKKVRKSRRLKKNVFSRLGGASVGAVRGFLVAFIFLLPIIVIGGFVTALDEQIDLNQEGGTQTLSTSTQINSLIPSEFQGYLEQIYDMHRNGLGGIAAQIKINDKGVDRYLFDMVFTTEVVVGETKTPINFGNELESITGIAAVLVNGGYLEDGFDPMTIDQSNLEDLEKIFGYIGRSDLINYVIPVATKFGVSNILTDMIGVNLYEREASAAALDAFESIVWEDEFMRLYDVLAATLEFGSIQELMDYASDPALLAELSPEKAEELGNIIRAFSELRTLVLLNVAVDYATTLDTLQSQINWLDEADREAYLAERFAFITSNVEFFIGDGSDWQRMADMIEIIFSDDYDVDLPTLFTDFTNPEALLDPNNAEWIGAILEKFVEIEIIMNAIPFGVDFGVYNALGDQVERELADRITETLNEVSWDDEILNIGDIYKEVVKLGIASIFGENPDYFLLIDDIAVNNMDAIRTIVSKLFEDSEVINAAIELAVPIVLDTMIEDTDLRDLAHDVLISDEEEGVVDFNFGSEINQILTIVETLYEFTTASEIASIGAMSTIEILDLVSSFGGVREADLNNLTTAISNLQILQRASKSGLDYVKNTMNLDVLYVPDEVNLADDINAILNLAYYTAAYINENEATYGLFEDVDFTDLILDETFRSYLLSTPANNHSNLLFTNIAYNIANNLETFGVASYVTVPSDLLNAPYDDALWATEINNLLGSIFDFAAAIGTSDGITLSIRGVSEVALDPMSLPITVVTQFSDFAKTEDTFGNLEASRILRASIISTIESLGDSIATGIGGYQLRVPDTVVDGDLLKEGVLAELIHALALTLDDLNNTLGYETIGQAIAPGDPYDYLVAYNNLDDNTLFTLTTAELILGILSDVILSEEIQAFVRETVNNLSLGFEVTSGFFNITREDNVLAQNEIYELFLSVKAMGITKELIFNPTGEVFAYLQSLDDDRLNQIFDVTLLREIVTTILTDENIILFGAQYASDTYNGFRGSIAQLSEVDINFEPLIRSIGNAKAEDGFADTFEVKNLIRAFNALEIYSLDEFNSLRSLEAAHQRIKETEFIETLMESDRLHQGISDLISQEGPLDQLAAILSAQITSITGVDTTITGAQLSFATEKYGIFETSGPNDGRIKVNEIKALVLSGTRLNWTSLGLGSGLELVSGVADLLLSEGYDNERHIDVILDSNILMALFDKLLNFEHGGLGLADVAIEFANQRAQTIGALSGLELTSDILFYDQRAYDANLVINKQEFIEMIEAITFIDFSQTVGVYTFTQMAVNDTIGELFDSYIIHSLFSNILDNPGLRVVAANAVNNAQTAFVIDESFFAIDPVLKDGDLIKVEEIQNLLISVDLLGITSASPAGLGVQSLTGLIGRNYDAVEDKDDLDRFFDSGFIYIYLDKILQFSDAGNFVTQTLENALGQTIDPGINLLPPQEVIGVDGIDTEIEVDRVTKTEFRKIVVSLKTIGIETPAEPGTLGLGLLLDLIDVNNPNDDFATVLDSDYLYVLIARIFGLPFLDEYLGTVLANALGGDASTLTMTAPVDALGNAGVEDGLITKVELRQIFVSIKLIADEEGFSQETALNNLLNLIDDDKLPGDTDDFDLFLESKYVWDKISVLLLAEQTITLLSAGRFDAEDFLIPAPATVTIGGKERLTQEEIRAIFRGLKILGLDDFENVELGIDTITSLSDEDLDKLLESEYLYTVIDLNIKAEETLSLPDGAFEDGGVYDGMIKKTEIKDVFKTLEILAITDFNNVDPESITIAQVQQVLDETDSLVVQYLLSQAIIEAIGADKIPVEAYLDGNVEQGILSPDELSELLDALTILAGGNTDQPLTDIDLDNITVGNVEDLEDNESFIIKQLISDAIVDIIGLDNIPPEAFILTSNNPTVLLGTQTLDAPTNRLTDAEISAMIEAIVILAGGDRSVLVTEISTDVTVGQTKQLSLLDSFVIKQLVTNSIKDVIDPDDEGKIPVEAFVDQDPTKRLTDDEIAAMVEAIDILAGGDDTVLVAEISTDVNVGQLKELKTNNSLIIKQVLTDAIKDIIDPDDEGKIPVEAYVDNDPTKRLTDTEINEMIDAIVILANDDDTVLVENISTDVNVGQLKQLKTNNSLIIKQVLTDAIVDVIDPNSEGKIPVDAYVDNDPTKRLTDTEINEMIDAIVILANDDDTVLVTDIVTDINVGQLKALKTNNSLIIKQLVSDSIVDTLSVDTDIPNEAYIDNDPTNRLSDDEINAMIDAIDILADGDDTVLVSAISTDVTVGQLKALKTNSSLIIKQLVSDAIVDTLSVDTDIPNEAYIDQDPTNRLTDDEINEMIDAIDILADGNNALLVADISTDVTVGQLKQFKTNNSLIIKQLVSDAIVDTLSVDNTIPDEAYIDQDSNNRLTNDEINEMIDAIDILANGNDALLVSAISTDVTVGQLKELKTNNSIIIKQLVSDSIVDTLSVNNTIPDEAYIDQDSNNRLTNDEINAMIDAIDILAGGDDALLVSDISTDITIGQLKDLNASPSVIMAKLISDAIVDAVGAANVPAGAYIDNDSNNNLTEDEITAMIGVLEILANPVPPQVVNDVLVSSIDTNVTVGQTQELKTSESLIIKQIISDSIIEMIGAANIPNEAYIDNTPGNRLTNDEIEKMIDAISILGDDEDLVTDIDTDITIGQLKDLNASESIIIKKLISDQIVEAVGVGSVPDDAYIDNTPGNNLKPTEITAMINVLEILAGSEVPGDKDDEKVTSVSTNVTVGQTQQLKTSESVIIKQIITDSIVTMIGAANIPDEAYIDEDSDNRLTDNEIEKMIDALAILGDDDDLVTDLDTDVTIGQVKQLEASESLIIQKLISDTIVEMLGAGRIPDDAYIDETPGNNLKPSEVSAMISMLETLAPDPIAPLTKDDTVVSTIVINEANLTVETLKSFPDDSIILNRMISTAIIDALGADKVPDESYTELVNKKDIKRAEIDALLDALDLLGLETDGASSIGAADITFAQIDEVVAIGTNDLVNYPLGFSPIIAHILSTPMVASVSDVRGGFDYGIPTTAYRNDNDLKYDEITKLISALKTIGNVGTDPGQEDPETTSLADVTINPQGFGPDLLSDLIAEDSLIVYRLISIGINDAGIANDDAYAQVGDTNHDPGLPGAPVIRDIKIAEMNHIVEAMEILGISSIANVTSEITVAKLKDLDATDRETLVEADTNGPNTIIYYIISETVDPDNDLFTTPPIIDSDDYYVMDGATRVRLKRTSISDALALIP